MDSIKMTVRQEYGENVSNKAMTRVGCMLSGGLVGVTVVSGVVLASVSVRAESSVVKNASVTVSSACTLSATGTTHSTTLSNGAVSSNVGEGTIKVSCNDYLGFAVYAIGFTDDIHGKNVLTNSDLGSQYDIETSTSTSNGSSWAMKLATVSSPTPAYPISIEGNFDNFHTVPDDYTLVAKRTAATDTGTGATGAVFTTTYQIFINDVQPAGTYTGKVKYLMVHPNNAPTPIKPQGLCPSSEVCMQQMTSQMLSDKLPNAGDTTTLYDSRDGQAYTVGKLADGKYWLLDDLVLDLVDRIDVLDATNTNATNTSLGYLKGTASRDPNVDVNGNYATAGVSNVWASNSFSAPLINTSRKNMVPTDAMSTAGGWKSGVFYNYCAASAGSYCYGDNTSSGSSSGNAAEDICPSGWRMPTGGGSGEYQDLYNISSYSSYETYRAALRIPLTGFFTNGSLSYENNTVFLWSSTRSSDTDMHRLGVNTGGIYPPYNSSRVDGYIVRCVFDS